MPHHKGQQQQLGASFPVSGVGMQQSFPPAADFSRSVVPVGPTRGTMSMRGRHPLPGSISSWTTPQMGKMVHRVPETMSTEGASRATDGALSSSMRTDFRSSSSFDNAHEVAASVLLLAASTEKPNVESKDEIPSGTVTAPGEETISNSGPLKKRKKVEDIMRKKPAETEPCHVSPMSHGSKATTMVDSDSSPHHKRTGSAPSISTSHASSYDWKDGQALPEAAKISEVQQITPPNHVVILHFPSVLHSVLSESEFAGSVVQWLPHGQAWRILRWDALRKQVLPKFFPQLREEDGKSGRVEVTSSAGSVDAFLWHLSAWGFEEITDGPDVGAYSHVLFRRDLPQLCRDMRFTPGSEKGEQSPGAASTGSRKEAIASNAGDSRSILQVPSLASTNTGASGPSEMMSKSLAGEEAMPGHKKAASLGTYPPMGLHPAAHFASTGWPVRQMDGSVFVHYRSDEMAMADAWKFYGPNPPPQQMVPGRSLSTRGGLAPFSPSARIRSSRGASRMATATRTMSQDSMAPIGTSGSATASHKPNFPISHRGRGGPRRISLPKTETNEKVVAAPASSIADAPSTAAGSNGDVSKKEDQPRQSALKRKLPLTRNTTD